MDLEASDAIDGLRTDVAALGSDLRTGLADVGQEIREGLAQLVESLRDDVRISAEGLVALAAKVDALRPNHL